MQDDVGYVFEWDPSKAKSNAKKHGETFDEASTVFGDPLAILMPIPTTLLSKSAMFFSESPAGVGYSS